MIKAYVFDLDGTLLTTNKQIDESSIIAIQNLKDSGCTIVLASDRRLSELVSFADELKLDKHDILICKNGVICIMERKN